MDKTKLAIIGPYSGINNLEVMAEAQNYNEFLSRLIKSTMPLDGIVLDFGAGIGTFEDRLSSAGYKLECLEIAPELIKHLRSRGYKVWEKTTEIPKGHIAGAFSLNVLEHIENDAKALRELRPSLLDGSKVLLYVPAFNLLYSSMDRKVGHFRRYRKLDMVTMLKKCGYKITSIRYVDTVGFFAALTFRFIGNNRGELSSRAVYFFDHWLFPFNKLLDPLCGRWFGKNLVVIAQKGRI